MEALSKTRRKELGTRTPLFAATLEVIQSIVAEFETLAFTKAEDLPFDDRLYNPAEATLRPYLRSNTNIDRGIVSSTVFGHRLSITSPERLNEPLHISIYPLTSSQEIQIMLNVNGYCATLATEDPGSEAFSTELKKLLAVWRDNTFRRTFRLGNRDFRR